MLASSPGKGATAGFEAARHGISPAASAVGEIWHNVRGGVKRASWWNTLVDVAAEVPGPSFGAPASAALVAELHWVANRRADGSFAEDTKAFHPISSIMANDHVRVFNLYYRQAGAGGAWSLKVGQLAVDDDFMLSAYAGLFAHSAFGAMPSQTATPLHSAAGPQPAVPIYAVAAPGVWWRLDPGDGVSWQTGVYYGSPGLDTRANRGFKWGRAADSGVLVFSEASWQYPLGGRSATTRLGVSAHTGPFADFGAIRANHRDAVVRGLCSVYAIQDVALAADAAGAPNWGAFGRVGVSPQDERCAVRLYADAGVNRYRPFARRPRDVFGAAVSVTRFGHEFGALAGLARSETTVEFTYQARLSSRLTVQGDVQFLLDSSPSAASGRRETATIIGVRTTLTL